MFFFFYATSKIVHINPIQLPPLHAVQVEEVVLKLAASILANTSILIQIQIAVVLKMTFALEVQMLFPRKTELIVLIRYVTIAGGQWATTFNGPREHVI